MDKQAKTKCVTLFPVSLIRHHGVSAKVAYAHHDSNKNVFDEWVLTFQATNPSTAIKRKTGEGNFYPFTCFLT